MEQPNKLMTQNEIIKEYPGKWVLVEVTKGTKKNVKEGIVRFVATNDEMPTVLTNCKKKVLDCERERTTRTKTNVKEDIVRLVVTNDEMPTALINCKKKGPDSERERTTVGSFSGIIDGANFGISVKELSNEN